MRTITQARADWRIILGGLFFVVLALQGCTNTVTVKYGPNGQGNNQTNTGVGLCNVVPSDGAPLNLDPAKTTCKTSTGASMTCPTNAFCNTSTTMCDRTSPGSQNRTTCKTFWTQSSQGSLEGSCKCDIKY